MKRCIPALVLMLSLGAALVSTGRPSAAGAVGGIRLPSQGLGDRAFLAAAKGEERPWKCCDSLFPVEGLDSEPVFFCQDIVDRCADACTDCQKAADFGFDLPGSICMTGYQGETGPSCTGAGEVHGAAAAVVAGGN